MAAPTPYSPSYSFAGFQALNPAQPLPATPLDVQFADIETALDSLIAALADVRRADGRIENGSVTLDALDADVAALLQTADPRTTVADLAPSAFAAQVEAEAGAANDKIMTPLRVAQAITAQRPLALQAEAEAGTNNVAVTTPLRVAQAIAALRPLASQAQAQGGTNNATVMTPLRVAEALAALRPAFTATQNLTWTAITAGTSDTRDITVAGAAVNDRVVIGWPAAGPNDGLAVTAWVTSTNTVRIRLRNTSGGSITPFSGASVAVAVTCLRY